MSGERDSAGTAGPGRRRPARERILRAAARRFYQEGVTATGIDTITAEAGVAKMSLYNNFSSKADLVRAYLDDRHEDWLVRYREHVGAEPDPRDGVLGVFDTYIDGADALPRATSGVRTAQRRRGDARRTRGAGAGALKQKEEVERMIAEHVTALLPGRPDAARATARRSPSLLEGAMVRAGLEGDSRCLRDARAMAERLLDQA